MLSELNISHEIVAFMGNEGAGKTTIAEIVAADSGLDVIVTGELVRAAKKRAILPGASALDLECKDTLDNHRYVTAHMFTQILAAELSKEKYAKGVIIDGSCRTLDETIDFWETLKTIDREMPFTMVHLRISAWKSIERLIGANRPGREADDTPEAILKRIMQYNKDLAGRVNVIKKHGKIVHADVSGTKERALENVYTALRNR